MTPLANTRCQSRGPTLSGGFALGGSGAGGSGVSGPVPGVPAGGLPDWGFGACGLLGSPTVAGFCEAPGPVSLPWPAAGPPFSPGVPLVPVGSVPRLLSSWLSVGGCSMMLPPGGGFEGLVSKLGGFDSCGVSRKFFGAGGVEQVGSGPAWQSWGGSGGSGGTGKHPSGSVRHAQISSLYKHRTVMTPIPIPPMQLRPQLPPPPPLPSQPCTDGNTLQIGVLPPPSSAAPPLLSSPWPPPPFPHDPSTIASGLP